MKTPFSYVCTFVFRVLFQQFNMSSLTLNIGSVSDTYIPTSNTTSKVKIARTCARSSSIPQFNRNMEKMKTLVHKAYEWLDKMPFNTWVRAYFSTFPKCDMLLNNSCEVFNSYILEAREMPILSMLEQIKG